MLPSAPMRDWLEDSGSLTRRLQAACGQGFGVQLLEQRRHRPLPSEAARLALHPGRLALVREVRLNCGDQTWVFARSLIPLTSLRGAARRLTRLGNRPLGALLFADPSAERGLMEFARLQPGQSLYEKAVAGLAQRPERLWGRRTLFRFAGKPLLVNEVFLSELEIRQGRLIP
ncbi:MAG: chorismate lyase [Gammaproteobacteria bacterium SHHR-1]|uniref:chorismate--pyruvate lyase family protein n=1 Tax=Magnetovirga frankeli TaxID=947516 RepID=UPI001292EEFA|nr:chorismate lyase [gamma proteobacterium SS-5]